MIDTFSSLSTSQLIAGRGMSPLIPLLISQAANGVNPGRARRGGARGGGRGVTGGRASNAGPWGGGEGDERRGGTEDGDGGGGGGGECGVGGMSAKERMKERTKYLKHKGYCENCQVHYPQVR